MDSPKRIFQLDQLLTLQNNVVLMVDRTDYTEANQITLQQLRDYIGGHNPVTLMTPNNGLVLNGQELGINVVTTMKPGVCPTLPNNVNLYLNGLGQWTTPAGGVTPVDDIFDWNVDRYTPYTTSLAGRFDTSTTYPEYWTRLNYNGQLVARMFSTSGANYLSRGALAVAGNGTSSSGYPLLHISTFLGNVELFAYKQFSTEPGFGYETVPIYIGSINTRSGIYRNQEWLKIDDKLATFTINFTNTVFEKGTANKYLYLDADKKVTYVDVIPGDNYDHWVLGTFDTEGDPTTSTVLSGELVMFTGDGDYIKITHTDELSGDQVVTIEFIPQAFNSLIDVTITSPDTGHVLQYNAVTEMWENTVLSIVTALNDLTDVTITTPSNGQVLVYDNTTSQWINATLTYPAPSLKLDDLTDVIADRPHNGAILKYNESIEQWVVAELLYTNDNDNLTINQYCDIIGSDALGGGVLRLTGHNPTTPVSYIRNSYFAGVIEFKGLSATATYSKVAQIYARAMEDHNSYARGTQFEFWTTPTGATTLNLTAKMANGRIEADQGFIAQTLSGLTNNISLIIGVSYSAGRQTLTFSRADVAVTGGIITSFTVQPPTIINLTGA